jgi:hypothetical protein
MVMVSLPKMSTTLTATSYSHFFLAADSALASCLRCLVSIFLTLSTAGKFDSPLRSAPDGDHFGDVNEMVLDGMATVKTG